MANARYYSSIAPPTTLTGGVGPSNTTIQVASTAGLPGSLPFTLSLDYGAASEELVDVTAVGGLTLTVTRGVDGTSAASHNIGAVIRHVTSARDFTESRTHEASSTGVHGVAGAVVGTTDTQNLSNKTLVFATGSLRNVNIYNTGTNTLAVIGDSANPTIDRMWVVDNEVSLNPMIKINQVGSIQSIKKVAEADSTYRFRVTDSNGTTDRASILAGGTIQLTPTSTASLPHLDVIAPDLNNTKRSIRIAAAGGGSERFTVWNDGRIDVVGSDTTFSIFDITGPASHASFYLRVMDSALNALLSMDNTGKTLARATMDVKNDFHTGGTSIPVLRVFGRNPGQTGDLQQWIDAAGATQALMTAAGDLTLHQDFTWDGGTAWSTYTPTWRSDGTQPTVGNGTLTGRYKQFGKTIVLHISLSIGTTSTAGSGAYSWDLPFTAANTITYVGAGQFAGTNRWSGSTQAGANSTTCTMFVPAGTTTSNVVQINATQPNAPANGNIYRLALVYERA